MKIRLFLVGLLVAMDLLLMPAVARIPPYLPFARNPQPITRWQTEWLLRPLRSAWSLAAPQTEADRQARTGWLYLQVVMATPILALLWPKETGMVTRDGRPVSDPSNAKGSAKWRDRKELPKAFKVHKLGEPAMPPGLLAGVDRTEKPKQVYLIPPPGTKGALVNPLALVIGGPGVGKTRRLVLPNLWLLGQAKTDGAPNTIILTDPKGELYGYTSDYFRELGYRVFTLNLKDPKRSHHYDPIAEVVKALESGDPSGAAEAAWDVAHAFITVERTAHSKDDAFFTNAAESVIAATVLYVAREAPQGQKNMATVYRMITEYGKDGGDQLDDVFTAIQDIADPARLAYGIAALSQDKTRAGVLTTAATNLRLFADPSVVAMTAGSDYELSSLGQEPTVVFLLLPDDKSSRNAVAAMYLAQTYSALSRLASVSKGGRLPVTCYWILDEFANIGHIRDFDKWIGVMRGRGMSAMIVLQALQQLEARYGRDEAEVISACCDTWLYLKTNSRATAKEISEKLGKYTIRTRTNSSTIRRLDYSTGSSEHLDGRELLTPDEVLRWPMGQVLILQAGLDPTKLSLADMSEWPAPFEEGDQPPLREDLPADAPWLPTL